MYVSLQKKQIHKSQIKEEWEEDGERTQQFVLIRVSKRVWGIKSETKLDLCSHVIYGLRCACTHVSGCVFVCLCVCVSVCECGVERQNLFFARLSQILFIAHMNAVPRNSNMQIERQHECNAHSNPSF